MKKKIIWGIVLSAVHLIASIMAGSLGWNWQMVIVSLASSVAVFTCYKTITTKFYGAVLIVLPFYLLYTTSSILAESYYTFPIWIYGALVVFLTWLLMRVNSLVWFNILVLVIIIAIGGIWVWPNTFAWQETKNNPSQYSLSSSIIVDSSERAVSLQSFKGKIVLVDIWHSACLSCIEKFPEVQRLYEQYKDDSLVKIISLNIPLRKDKGRRPAWLTRSYSFEKLYFLNAVEHSKFSKVIFPVFLVLDKNLECRYAGDFNIGWNVFIGNAKTIIKELKREI